MGQVLAVILIDRAQIGAELVAGHRAGQHSTVEERAVVVRAVPLDQHRSDKPAIGSSVNDNSPGLAEAIDEILACPRYPRRIAARQTRDTDTSKQSRVAEPHLQAIS